MKTFQRVLGIVLLICMACTLASCNSIALWREERTKEASIVSDEVVNPSLRFQVFAPMDGTGDLIMYEPYQWAKHGLRGKSYITDAGYYLAVSKGGYYEWADFDQLETGDDLEVVVSSLAYDGTIHGQRCYRTVTSQNYNLYVRQGSGYTLATAIPLDNTLSLYCYDEETSSFILYDESVEETFGSLIASTLTSTGKTLLYCDSAKNYYIPNTEQVERGESLFVPTFAPYDPNSQDDLEAYGNLVYASFTSTGYTLSVRVDGLYQTATPKQVEEGVDLYALGNVVSYALVGYTGIVAEIVVPDVYTDPITHRSFPVRRICAHPEYTDCSLYGNQVITSIDIPSSVTSIGSLALANMQNLHTIRFGGDSVLLVGNYAFLGDLKLRSVVVGQRDLRDSEGNVIRADNDVFTDCPLRESEGFIS